MTARLRFYAPVNNMADMAFVNDERRRETPILHDGYVHIDGETHVLNYDTNILNLDDNREVTPGADLEDDYDIPSKSDSPEEDVDIEVA